VKLACVVQRYGADIAGGSEAHCRDLAQRLTPRHDVTVLTTCARDYVTWANELPTGETRDGGVRVLRFAVARSRRRRAFADLSDVVFDGGAPAATQDAWFAGNGPETPGLLQHLREHGADYDLVLFWTFRYAPSYFGVPLVRDRAVLVPTAEEDPAIRLDVLERFFALPAGWLFLTPEEQLLVSDRAGRSLSPSATIGTGLDPAGPPAGRDLLDAAGIPQRYLLYLGRVDRNKGCDTLLDYYQEYAAHPRDPAATADTRDDVTLVLAGPAKMQLPGHPHIRALGYVSDAMRTALLAHARALVVPSRYESLSLVLLEAWNQGTPALVNARCRVLDGQVRRANGGLAYRSSGEFREALDHLLSNEASRAAFGRQGLAYVEREYRWPVVIDRVERLLERVRARRQGGSGAADPPPADRSR
jgi:glycosyltransferase involved in cell wall biosynthesis